jgi:hypothetical protein
MCGILFFLEEQKYLALKYLAVLQLCISIGCLISVLGVGQVSYVRIVGVACPPPEG